MYVGNLWIHGIMFSIFQNVIMRKTKLYFTKETRTSIVDVELIY